MELPEPFFGALRWISQAEQSCGFSQDFARSPLRAEHANISGPHVTRKQASETHSTARISLL